MTTTTKTTNGSFYFMVSFNEPTGELSDLLNRIIIIIIIIMNTISN